MALIMMDPAQMNVLASKVESEIPPGKTFALVGFIDANGVEAAAVMSTLGGAIRGEAIFRHKWTGENEVGAKLLASW